MISSKFHPPKMMIERDLSLDLFSDLYQFRDCSSCQWCYSLRQNLSERIGMQEKWEELIDYLRRNDALCGKLETIRRRVEGSICKWNVCFKCFLEGKISSKPSLENMKKPLDLEMIDGSRNINQSGQCASHGQFFEPLCIGDAPALMCLKLPKKLELEAIHLGPLRLKWSGTRLLSVTESPFAFIPNQVRWGDIISYKCEYALISPENRHSIMESYFYLLRRTTKPIPRSPPLMDLFAAMNYRKYVWILQHGIMGTSNSGFAVTGENFLQRTSQKTRMLSSHAQENVEKEVKKTLKDDGKQADATVRIEAVMNHYTVIPKTDDDAECKHEGKDHTYHPSMAMQENSDDSGSDPSFTPPPVSRRHLLYEDEVAQTERRDEKRKEKMKRIRDEMNASTCEEKEKDEMGRNESESVSESESDLTDNSFRTSYEPVKGMEYRTCLLRAPSQAFSRSEIKPPRHKKLHVNEACNILRNDRFPFFSSSLKEIPELDFSLELENREQFVTSLRVNVDIDSIDVLTVPLGGTAFNTSSVSIFLTWSKGNIKEDEVSSRNNGFIRFITAYSDEYPGNYFGTDISVRTKDGGRFRSNDDEKLLNHPLQVQLGCINFSWSYSLKVSAILPSKSVLYFLKGEAALIELFDHYAYGDEGRGERISLRTRLCQFIWYVLSSVILLFSSIGTKDGASPGAWWRGTCCSFASVDAKEDSLHDERYGHLSDFNCAELLSEGSFTIALCLFARHQKALEQHAEIPGSLCCSALDRVALYRLPDHLYDTVNANVYDVLKADVGDRVCLEWFQQMWGKKTFALGEIIRFMTDQSRKGEQAFPTPQTNRQACKRGYLIVEDLLPLSSIIFRGTMHGAKTPAYTEVQLSKLTKKLNESFNPKAFLDGVVDVAYVFHGPPEQSLSVHLRREAASQMFKSNGIATTNALTPIGCEKTLTELGAYFSSSLGYPNFVGFSTRKGMCGLAESAISYSGMRKIKAYATKWRGDSYRGRTMYDSLPAKKLHKSFSNSKELYKKVLAVQTNENGEDEMKRYLREIQEEQQKVNHNILFRMKGLESFQNQDGFRVEYTCFFDKDFHFMKEPADILRMQEERNDMSQAMVRKLQSENDSYFPWWLAITMPCEFNKNQPLFLASGRVIHTFSNLLEMKALALSVEIFCRSAYVLSRLDHSNLHLRKQSSFIEPLLSTFSTTEAAAKFACILSSSLYRICYRQVDNVLCTKEGIPSSTDGLLLASGLAASWWYTGLPVIILSRLSRFPPLRCSYEIPKFGKKRKQIVSAKEATIVSSEDDLLLPRRLRFSTIHSYHSVRTLRISGNENEEHEKPDTILACVTHILETMMVETKSQKEELSFQIGTLFVKLLLADVSQRMLSFAKSKENAQRKWEELKFKETFDMKCIQNLSAKSQRNEMWPERYRIDTNPVRAESIVESVATGIDVLDGIFDFKLRPVKVSKGSGWTRKTIPIDADGFVLDEDFIATLFDRVKLHTDETGIEVSETGTIWRSILSLEALNDVLRYKGFRDGIFQDFFKPLSEAIRSCLKSAGFGAICPAFLRKRSELTSDSRSLWGPELLFAKMKFVRNGFEANTRNSNKRTNDQSKQLEDIRKIFDELSQIDEDRQREQQNSRKWEALTERYNEVSASFWLMNGVEERLLEKLKSRFNSVKEKRNLNKMDLVWAQAILEKLVQIRRATRDEGICCRISNKEIRTGRILKNRPSTKDAILYPWKDLYLDAEDIYKKKTRVKHAGRIFGNNFPLLFKTKTQSEIRKSGRELLENCFEYNVEDIFRRLRAKNNDKVAERRGHWRLSPTRIIAYIILQ